MTREKLVEIPGVDSGYFVSSLGEIISMKTGVPVSLRLHESHGGYLRCTPMLNKKSVTIKVAREVAYQQFKKILKQFRTRKPTPLPAKTKEA